MKNRCSFVHKFLFKFVPVVVDSLYVFESNELKDAGNSHIKSIYGGNNNEIPKRHSRQYTSIPKEINKKLFQKNITLFGTKPRIKQLKRVEIP